ncbi:hypothetical protein [Parabacteroides sp. Marseille-P3160]|uniref:hypothetical protein n=1 Tax=Parabacteroides sp. Marseille-P3160 TaxID=1917887 RepID=UPI0009BBAB7B|nr:hypothetical protein [Parabacteroides sp. Marseille-P3160]
MKRIRKGNSFNILYSAVTNEGEKIDLRQVEELTVKLAYWNGTVDVDYSFVEESIQVNVSDSLATGEHRLFISFKYAGFDFERDPKVFNIVSHSEDERNSSQCNVEIISIPVTDTLDVSNLHLINLSEEEISKLKEPATQAAEDVMRQMGEISADYIELKADTIRAINDAATATQNANAAAQNANDAAVLAEGAASDAEGKGNYAKQQGDNAKEQAERAETAADAITGNWINNW